MNNQHTEDAGVVAASPVVHETGMLPYRIVIRDLGDQHVVHTQVLEPGKEPWYHQVAPISKLEPVLIVWREPPEVLSILLSI